jgi:hypothetical protein
MKQHKYIFVLLLFFFVAPSWAQSSTNDEPFKFKPSFHQESGFSVFFNSYSIIPVGTYWGRLNMFEPKKYLSISASCPFSIGGSIGSFGSFLAIDVPLTVDLNIGDRATSKADIPAGAFIGGGGGFNMLVGGGMLRSYGPLAHAGVRVTSPLSGRSITLRISYLFGLGGIDANGIDFNPNVFGIGAFYAM